MIRSGSGRRPRAQRRTQCQARRLTLLDCGEHPDAVSQNCWITVEARRGKRRRVTCLVRLLEGEGNRPKLGHSRGGSDSGTYLRAIRAISADESWPKVLLQKDYHIVRSKKKKDEQERAAWRKRSAGIIALPLRGKDGHARNLALGSRRF